MPETAKIIIVGSGPAGVATAAALVRHRPELKDEVLLLEKARHPRHKLCGGGLTPWADEMLTTLGLQVEVPTFHINRVAFYLSDKPLYFDRPGMMRTVRRDEFDAAMVRRLQQRGVRVYEETAVRGIRVETDGVVLETDAGTMRCEVLVGADGAKSFVRRQLFRDDETRVSRLMEVVVDVDAARTSEFVEQSATLDFRAVRSGLQGYLWEFPSWVNGRAHLNIGVFDSRVLNGVRANLPEILKRRLEERGISSEHVCYMGHPERWYHPRKRYSQPRVLLVGDAAGIEPWLGEGISVALGYGPVAAATICAALDCGDFAFADYGRRINRSPLGWFLNRNRLIARFFYRPNFYRILPLFGRVLSWHMARKKAKAKPEGIGVLAVDM